MVAILSWPQWLKRGINPSMEGLDDSGQSKSILSQPTGCGGNLHPHGITSQDTCHQTSNIIHTLIGNKIVDHSDVVGASPVGAAPTTSSFST